MATVAQVQIACPCDAWSETEASALGERELAKCTLSRLPARLDRDLAKAAAQLELGRCVANTGEQAHGGGARERAPRQAASITPPRPPQTTSFPELPITTSSPTMSFSPGPNTTLSTALAANGGLRRALRFCLAVPAGWTLDAEATMFQMVWDGALPADASADAENAGELVQQIDKHAARDDFTSTPQGAAPVPQRRDEPDYQPTRSTSFWAAAVPCFGSPASSSACSATASGA